VPVIIGTRLFDESPAGSFHRVGIVETQNPPIPSIVQCQFIANAMRPRRVGLDDPGADLDPVLRPDSDLRSVQIKKNG